MVRLNENIAVRPVLSSIGLESDNMTREQLQRECGYGGAMAIADRLLAEGLITKNDYIKIKKLFLQKYAPLVAGSAENPRILT